MRRNNIDEQLREIPIRPSGDHVGTYVAMWPVGIPHGSAKNATRRVTITLPIGTKRDGVDAHSRAAKRLKAIATIAAHDDDLQGAPFYDGSPAHQKQAAEHFLKHDTVPLADGRTHGKPEFAAYYMRRVSDRDGFHTEGAYADIAPTVPQVERYLAHMSWLPLNYTIHT